MAPRAHYPSLAGKTVFITGGASGIGAALTAAFAAQKAKVAFADLLETESAALADSVARETGARPLFLRCDVRDVAALRETIGRVQAELGDIGVLVNNAGNYDRHELEEVEPAYWDEKIALNLRPMFFAAQAVLPQMKRLGGGAIVNLASIAPKMKTPKLPIYNTTKAAIVGLTRSLARELGPHEIRVNCISPGAVHTERERRLWRTPEAEAIRRAGQCLDAPILPEDVAELALFLASDAASKCTAQEFIIDGGWS
jgi:NAD(P)-dependent dehydrogenase (short-subunit alcohol dehydrogenase family)